MADISITQKHKLSHKKAKAAAKKVADKMAEEYDLESAWEGDVLVFKRSGVSGTLEVHATEARLEITLGFLFKAFASKIEVQVHKNMQKIFAGKP
ncbi:MAG TPA: polyhydroxyalkanoic acid system protein [Oxalobacteraceae bacterium]|jgi:putative polyhydroxyalkanoate system protein|nr:polyhydroxyalkanoic acid system protein [Oxalobacteraceae bacterium]